MIAHVARVGERRKSQDIAKPNVTAGLEAVSRQTSTTDSWIAGTRPAMTPSFIVADRQAITPLRRVSFQKPHTADYTPDPRG